MCSLFNLFHLMVHLVIITSPLLHYPLYILVLTYSVSAILYRGQGDINKSTLGVYKY